MQKSKLLSLVFILLFSTVSLLSQTYELRVIVEKANLYLEPDTNSQILETVEKDVILFIAMTWKDNWYYVSFKPEKSKFSIMGFVESSNVERFLNVQEKQDVPKVKVVPKEKNVQEKQDVTKVEVIPKKKEEIEIRELQEIQEIQPVKPEEKDYKKEFKLITLSSGLGQSYGGIGVFAQLNTEIGVSFHGGIGYFPSFFISQDYNELLVDQILFSGGIKYYFFSTKRLHPYLNLQFGGIGVEVMTLFGIPLFYTQKTLWGPSILGGVEIKLGAIGFVGAFGVSYSLTKIDWSEQNIFMTFDLGMLVYF